MANTERPQLVLVVDTGTDDAGALIWAATDPRVDLVAVVADWGNVDVDLTARNTLDVLHAAGRDDVPVFRGGGKSTAGANPARFDASIVMGTDGLNGVRLARAPRQAEDLGGAEALVKLANERPGQLTLVAVSPFTPVAAALDLDPELPSKLWDVIIMGGAIASGGNLGAVAEANVGNDPAAAAKMVDAFGVPGVLASGRAPRMVPLDATHVGTISEAEIAAADATALTGGQALHAIWQASWNFAHLEHGDGLPVHDLLAVCCCVDDQLCQWVTMPVSVDTAGGPAWGMTVGDRRMPMLEQAPMPDEQRAQLFELLGFAPARWKVAMSADAERFRAFVHSWLGI